MSAFTPANIRQSATLSSLPAIDHPYTAPWHARGVKSRSQVQTVWARIKEAMTAHSQYKDRATQTTAARLAGVEQPTVSDWNKPGRGPELKNAIQLAKKLNVCVEWIYTGEGGMRPIPQQDAHLRELLAVWDRVSPEDRARLVSFAVVAARGQTPFSEPAPEQSLPSRRAY